MTKLFSKTAYAGKNIIISGGAGDIGVEIAMEFAKAGASKIALLDNDKKQLTHAADSLKETSSTVLEINVDLSNEQSIKKTIKEIYAESECWDVLVTTAGVYIGGMLTDYKADDWDTLMLVNARSVFLLSKLVATKMIESGHGKIIHIGSSSTYYGTPGSGVYAASKAVINQLTQTMAVEWGPHNIQVNTVCPTVTETRFLRFAVGDSRHENLREKLKTKMPFNRLLQPSDIAPTVLFLASDESQYINGAIIPIDGGSRLGST